MRKIKNIFIRNIIDEKNAFLVWNIITILCAFFITVLFPHYQKYKELNEIISSLPPFIKALFGGEIMQFTSLEGFLTLEFFNSTWLIIAGIYVCTLFSGVISREIEKKTFEILLSQPVTRYQVIIAKFTVCILYLLFLTFSTFIATYLGILWIKTEINIIVLLKVIIDAFFFFLTLGSIAFLFSCIFDEQRKSMYLSIGLFLFMYFFSIVQSLLPHIKWLEFFSLFHYYNASKIVNTNQLNPENIIALSAFSLFLFSISLLYFQKKNL